MVNYYAAAVQCNKAKLPDNIPDYTTLQADGTSRMRNVNTIAQDIADSYPSTE